MVIILYSRLVILYFLSFRFVGFFALFLSLLVSACCIKDKSFSLDRFCSENHPKPLWLGDPYLGLSGAPSRDIYFIGYSDWQNSWTSSALMAERSARIALSSSLSKFIDREIAEVIRIHGSSALQETYRSSSRRTMLNNFVQSIVVSHVRSVGEWYDCKSGKFLVRMRVNLLDIHNDVIATMERYNNNLGIVGNDAGIIKIVANRFISSLREYLHSDRIRAALIKESSIDDGIEN